MSQTQVPAGSALARKVFGAALFAQTVRKPGLASKLTGPAPKQSDAEAKLKGQTAPDMPIVRVTDLSKTAGDAVSVDMFNMIGGQPITGDQNAEGKGTALTSSSMDIKINLLTKVVDAGGKMAQQRTVHQLRGLAMAQLAGYFPRLDDQQCLVHLAGARGSQTGMDWIVPTASDANFSDIMINQVLAPSYNRHYVANNGAGGTAAVGGLTQGGLQLQSVLTTDVFKLEHVDSLRALLDNMDVPMQPVKIMDDPAAEDEPMYVLYVTAAQWNSILTNTSNTNWRTMLQNAWNRKSYGSKHPLFTGEAGLWNGILIRKMDRLAIQFAASEAVPYITSANAATATETNATVAAGLSTTHVVHRAMLLGAQALGNVYGKNQTSDFYMSWMERPYNFDRNLEVAADTMNGKSKIRFKYAQADGTNVPTDHGVLVLDTVVPKPAV